MVPALHGYCPVTSTAWFQHCMVTALLPARHGSSTAWLLPCYQHGMVPALHGYCPVTSAAWSQHCTEEQRLHARKLYHNYVKTLLACLWNTISLVGVAQRAQVAAAGLSQHLWQFFSVLTWKLFIICIVDLKYIHHMHTVQVVYPLSTWTVCMWCMW